MLSYFLKCRKNTESKNLRVANKRPMPLSIKESKEKYYTKLPSRLADPIISPKTYWCILKTFLNKKNSLHTSSFS